MTLAPPPTKPLAASSTFVAPPGVMFPRTRRRPVRVSFSACAADPCLINRHRTSRSHLASEIISRAPVLSPPDRALILAVNVENLSFRQLAAVARTQPRVLSRRYRRIVANLLNDIVPYVLHHHRCWPRMLQRVADRCFLEQASITAAARSLRLSYHQVRLARAEVLLRFRHHQLIAPRAAAPPATASAQPTSNLSDIRPLAFLARPPKTPRSRHRNAA